MPAAKYIVGPRGEEREELLGFIRRGRPSARSAIRARVLLKADEGLSDEAIAKALGIGSATVGRTRQRFVEEGLEAALKDKPRPGQPRKLSGQQEAHLIALACSEAPEGHKRWTLRLLANKVVALEYAESIAPETVRSILKKRAQAVAKAPVVYPESERAVRGVYGGGAGALRGAL